MASKRTAARSSNASCCGSVSHWWRDITSSTEATPCRRATNVLSDYHLVFSSRIVLAHYRWFRGRIEH
jgi:hypothetical protein